MRIVLVISLLALFVASCGSDQPELDPDLDAAALVATSAIEMNALDSYHVRFSVTMQRDDVREDGVWEFDFVPPDTYRFVFYAEEGTERNVCETPDRDETCTPVRTTVTERIRFEGLYVGEFVYGRQCGGDDCGDWEREPRPETPVFGPTSTYLPQWPIVALEMLENASAIEASRIAGVETVRVRGSVNMIRAVLENQRRVLETLGITTFGTKCEMFDIPMNTEGSFEETFANEDSVAFQDLNPATVDVWISPEDGRLHRLTITGPVEDAGEPSTIEFTIDYSEFNDVLLEAPEIDEDGE